MCMAINAAPASAATLTMSKLKIYLGKAFVGVKQLK